MLKLADLESADAPAGFSLAGLYTHGEAFCALHGYEYERSVLMSLPDLRAGHSTLCSPRTLVLVTHGYEPCFECDGDCLCSGKYFHVVDVRRAIATAL